LNKKSLKYEKFFAKSIKTIKLTVISKNIEKYFSGA